MARTKAPGAPDRTTSVVVPLTEEELERLRTLATEGDEPMTALVRRWLKKAWNEREARLAR
jgi:hypothetical protein